MQSLFLRFVISTLLLMSSVCASTQSEEEGGNKSTRKLYTYTSSIPPLFTGSDEDPVTFTYNQLLMNNSSEGNQKAKILYSVLQECPYHSFVKMSHPNHEITLFGINIGDLRYCEGEEGWPQTLFNKMVNKNNDSQFNISCISSREIRIDHHFREKFKDGEWGDDTKENKLYELLNRLGIMKVLPKEEFDREIPIGILMGDELEFDMTPKQEKKLQHLFGISLEKTKWAQRLNELSPDLELSKFSTKKEMKAFFFEKYAQVLNERDSQKGESAKLEEKLKETTQVHENMQKEISAKDKEIKTLSASAQQMSAQNIKAQEEITGLRQIKENLESSLAQLKKKTSELFENMHNLMNDFSN